MEWALKSSQNLVGSSNNNIPAVVAPVGGGVLPGYRYCGSQSAQLGKTIEHIPLPIVEIEPSSTMETVERKLPCWYQLDFSMPRASGT